MSIYTGRGLDVVLAGENEARKMTEKDATTDNGFVIHKGRSVDASKQFIGHYTIRL
jgi:hypothetical protein